MKAPWRPVLGGVVVVLVGAVGLVRGAMPPSPVPTQTDSVTSTSQPTGGSR
jgi:hypothetical protein